MTLADDTGSVAQGNILESGAQQQAAYRHTGSTDTVDDHLYRFLVFPHHFQCIQKTCQRNHCRAVLIVMKNRDIADLF